MFENPLASPNPAGQEHHATSGGKSIAILAGQGIIFDSVESVTETAFIEGVSEYYRDVQGKGEEIYCDSNNEDQNFLSHNIQTCTECLNWNEISPAGANDDCPDETVIDWLRQNPRIVRQFLNAVPGRFLSLLKIHPYRVAEYLEDISSGDLLAKFFGRYPTTFMPVLLENCDLLENTLEAEPSLLHNLLLSKPIIISGFFASHPHAFDNYVINNFKRVSDAFSGLVTSETWLQRFNAGRPDDRSSNRSDGHVEAAAKHTLTECVNPLSIHGIPDHIDQFEKPEAIDEAQSQDSGLSADNYSTPQTFASMDSIASLESPMRRSPLLSYERNDKTREAMSFDGSASDMSGTLAKHSEDILRQHSDSDSEPLMLKRRRSKLGRDLNLSKIDGDSEKSQSRHLAGVAGSSAEFGEPISLLSPDSPTPNQPQSTQGNGEAGERTFIEYLSQMLDDKGALRKHYPLVDVPYPAPASALVYAAKKKQTKQWGLHEHDILIKHMLDIRDEGAFHGEDRFREAAERMSRINRLDRSWTSVKNIWNRVGRQRSGFDERKNQSAPLSTSRQGRNAQSIRAQAQASRDATRGVCRARTSTLSARQPGGLIEVSHVSTSGQQSLGATNESHVDCNHYPSPATSLLGTNSIEVGVSRSSISELESYREIIQKQIHEQLQIQVKSAQTGLESHIQEAIAHSQQQAENAAQKASEMAAQNNALQLQLLKCMDKIMDGTIRSKSPVVSSGRSLDNVSNKKRPQDNNNDNANETQHQSLPTSKKRRNMPSATVSVTQSHPYPTFRRQSPKLRRSCGPEEDPSRQRDNGSSRTRATRRNRYADREINSVRSDRDRHIRPDYYH